MRPRALRPVLLTATGGGSRRQSGPNTDADRAVGDSVSRVQKRLDFFVAPDRHAHTSAVRASPAPLVSPKPASRWLEDPTPYRSDLARPKGKNRSPQRR